MNIYIYTYIHTYIYKWIYIYIHIFLFFFVMFVGSWWIHWTHQSFSTMPHSEARATPRLPLVGHLDGGVHSWRTSSSFLVIQTAGFHGGFNGSTLDFNGIDAKLIQQKWRCHLGFCQSVLTSRQGVPIFYGNSSLFFWQPLQLTVRASKSGVDITWWIGLQTDLDIEPSWDWIGRHSLPHWKCLFF